MHKIVALKLKYLKTLFFCLFIFPFCNAQKYQFIETLDGHRIKANEIFLLSIKS